MARKQPKISEAEMRLLQLLWDDSPLGATEIADRVANERGWTITTVKTLLSRLVAKGALTAKPQGRKYLYAPAIDRDDVAVSQARGLIDRLFGGRVSPLVAQLAEQQELDEQDIAELEKIVRGLRK
ncbi:MAG TPA: BlaI/MecI/CopY family transcriptional regulator [Sphingomicrobium sp.]|nr:BlaI/MecI/CopY family transcriptional regulator [Sphingomicrobium sp.]